MSHRRLPAGDLELKGLLYCDTCATLFPASECQRGMCPSCLAANLPIPSWLRPALLSDVDVYPSASVGSDR